ncbi:hypothetical protein CHY_2130 [Carboxydothermus hydrogenoformans Z-2901]|uniref:Uncharacterized protein n=1 Tax=Carboxydothermus hydrogenoformans (strain ATCC BAA-161 / DSM 6008 / Z-2901) TaxID=246194 RepID=Q3AA90_CARHZ|nr:hypothetical protein CHY_2130 [Carboxydothermus hydrogenoformans Z-2901]
MNNGMVYTLKWIIIILINVMIIKIIMNIINAFGIKFVENFQDIWKKMRKRK